LEIDLIHLKALLAFESYTSNQQKPQSPSTPLNLKSWDLDSSTDSESATASVTNSYFYNSNPMLQPFLHEPPPPNYYPTISYSLDPSYDNQSHHFGYFDSAQVMPSPSDSISSGSASSFNDEEQMTDYPSFPHPNSQVYNNNSHAYFGYTVPSNSVPTNTYSTKVEHPKSGSGSVHLWQFIRELLDRPSEYSSCVRWVDRTEGTFKIESSHHVSIFHLFINNNLFSWLDSGD
jgi:hypothetical protein